MPYVALPLLTFTQGNAAFLFDTAAVCALIENFPERRGQALGVAKSFVGLSAALFSSASLGWFPYDVVSFLPFVGAQYALTGCVGSLLLARPRSR